MERPCSRVIVVPNLLKSSTNSPVISSLSVDVAEKLRLVLTTDAARTQSLLKAFHAAREPDQVKTFFVDVSVGAGGRISGGRAPGPGPELSSRPMQPAPGRAWHATWGRGRACSAARAGRGRAGPWSGCGRGRRSHRGGQVPSNPVPCGR